MAQNSEEDNKEAESFNAGRDLEHLVNVLNDAIFLFNDFKHPNESRWCKIGVRDLT